MKFTRKAIPTALAIPVLAAVVALSVGITLAVAHRSRPADRTDDLSRRTAAPAADSSQAEPVVKDPDTIAIPGYDFLELKASTREQSLPLYNPEVNSCFFRISLLLDGETIWRSGLLAPGESVTQQTLDCALAAGEYSATLKYECFANQSGTASLNGSEIGFTLHVR